MDKEGQPGSSSRGRTLSYSPGLSETLLGRGLKKSEAEIMLASRVMGFAQHAIRPFGTRAGLKMASPVSGLLFSAGQWPIQCLDPVGG